MESSTPLTKQNVENIMIYQLQQEFSLSKEFASIYVMNYLSQNKRYTNDQIVEIINGPSPDANTHSMRRGNINKILQKLLE